MKLKSARALFCCTLLVLCLAACVGCSGSSDGAQKGETSGAALKSFSLLLSPYNANAAQGSNGAFVDTSNTSSGYVAACATSQTRLKFEVTCGNETYYYDLPTTGTPISCPLSAGNGAYQFTVWENTSGNHYAELFSTTANVTLSDEFQPFIRPNVFVNYDSNSKSTALAKELAADAENEGDLLQNTFNWITANISYDDTKAAEVVNATGYTPNPDQTIADKKGICFDYASLAAAILRSQGIPCKVVTGNVSPDDIYHAWNLVYIDGTWVTATIDVKRGVWTRIDTTFAASGTDFTKLAYTNRYTY